MSTLQFTSEHRIGVLMGGLSPERGISIKSGKSVVRSLRSRGYHVIEIVVNRDIATVLEGNKLMSLGWLSTVHMVRMDVFRVYSKSCRFLTLVPECSLARFPCTKPVPSGHFEILACDCVKMQYGLQINPSLLNGTHRLSSKIHSEALRLAFGFAIQTKIYEMPLQSANN